MVILLTPDGLRSRWGRRDIEYALGEQSYRKRVIPVLIGEPQEFPREEVPWILRHLRMIKLAEHAREEGRDTADRPGTPGGCLVTSLQLRGFCESRH